MNILTCISGVHTNKHNKAITNYGTQIIIITNKKNIFVVLKDNFSKDLVGLGACMIL